MTDTLKALIKQVVQINESIEEATGRGGTFTLEGPVYWEAELDLSDFVRGDMRFRSDHRRRLETPEAAVQSLIEEIRSSAVTWHSVAGTTSKEVAEASARRSHANFYHERNTTNYCKDTTP